MAKKPKFWNFRKFSSSVAVTAPPAAGTPHERSVSSCVAATPPAASSMSRLRWFAKSRTRAGARGKARASRRTVCNFTGETNGTSNSNSGLLPSSDDTGPPSQRAAPGSSSRAFSTPTPAHSTSPERSPSAAAARATRPAAAGPPAPPSARGRPSACAGAAPTAPRTAPPRFARRLTQVGMPWPQRRWQSASEKWLQFRETKS
mmetsp:Transcript_79058/g.218807  ORF Transcript_79058/g.218807 Transcript_79058/m.218807 type:complete len:203 (+) Transcript_79058:163-771(+)